MKVIAHLNMADYIKAHVFHFSRSKVTWLSGFIFAVVFFLYLMRKGDGRLFAAIFAAVIGAIGAKLFRLAFHVLAIVWLSYRIKGIIGAHEFTILDEGLSDKTSIGETISTFSRIDKVILLDHYIYVKANKSMTYVIPKRAFDSSNDFYRFGELLTEATGRR